MDNRGNTRKNRHNNNVLLLTVLIGFCILAIIEIIYGQAQIRMEKERLALEEQNHQTVEELKAEWNQLKGEPDVGEESMPTAGVEQSAKPEQEKILTNTEAASASTLSPQPVSVSDNSADGNYDMQIVLLGDSIMDNEDGTVGVAQLVGEQCNARVYNMAMGGTTAALLANENANFGMWESRSLLGVVHAIIGDISPDIFNGYRAREVLEECDFSKIDYFVIEYGINDFLAQIPISKYMENGEVRNIDAGRTYAGALDSAVIHLHNAFPDAKIVMIAPHFCQIFDGDKFVGDSYSIDYGYGSMVSYARVCGYVAEQHKEDGVIFYNAMEEGGIDAYNADKCTVDGIHLNEDGARIYSDLLIRLIKADFFPQE
ncbi:MAG: GDSL-type esterase/lipase family protein [Eubacterium sp.]|nr:GDSL-type esterase/lipase family protein [Eubacterium sp.]